jgi:hypothetical protein
MAIDFMYYIKQLANPLDQVLEIIFKDTLPNKRDFVLHPVIKTDGTEYNVVRNPPLYNIEGKHIIVDKLTTFSFLKFWIPNTLMYLSKIPAATNNVSYLYSFF